MKRCWERFVFEMVFSGCTVSPSFVELAVQLFTMLPRWHEKKIYFSNVSVRGATEFPQSKDPLLVTDLSDLFPSLHGISVHFKNSGFSGDHAEFLTRKLNSGSDERVVDKCDEAASSLASPGPVEEPPHPQAAQSACSAKSDLRDPWTEIRARCQRNAHDLVEELRRDDLQSVNRFLSKLGGVSTGLDRALLKVRTLLSSRFPDEELDKALLKKLESHSFWWPFEKPESVSVLTRWLNNEIRQVVYLAPFNRLISMDIPELFWPYVQERLTKGGDNRNVAVKFGVLPDESFPESSLEHCIISINEDGPLRQQNVQNELTGMKRYSGRFAVEMVVSGCTVSPSLVKLAVQLLAMLPRRYEKKISFSNVSVNAKEHPPLPLSVEDLVGEMSRQSEEPALVTALREVLPSLSGASVHVQDCGLSEADFQGLAGKLIRGSLEGGDSLFLVIGDGEKHPPRGGMCSIS